MSDVRDNYVVRFQNKNYTLEDAIKAALAENKNIQSFPGDTENSIVRNISNDLWHTGYSEWIRLGQDWFKYRGFKIPDRLETFKESFKRNSVQHPKLSGKEINALVEKEGYFKAFDKDGKDISDAEIKKFREYYHEHVKKYELGAPYPDDLQAIVRTVIEENNIEMFSVRKLF